ncbi:hypothetical protein C1H76_8322 [Elsinoe australis]|uniref:Uncharacterized protein n=1 Tax=Elsinoe australis TaxID=40998 RepID=A0A4U7AN06_9PEZI|nr:hypothetical protein C1H76_8322 [Elsinoe australis]
MSDPENPFEVAEQEARDQDDDTESLYAASVIAPRTTSAPTTATTINKSRDSTARQPPSEAQTQHSPLAPQQQAQPPPQPPTAFRSPSPPPLLQRPTSTPSFTPSPHWSNPPATTSAPIHYSIHAATNPPAAPHLVTEFYSSSEPPAAQSHNPITGSLTGPGPASNQHYAYLRSHLDTLGYAATPAAPRRTYTSPPEVGGSQAGPSSGGRRERKGWFRRGKDRSASRNGGGAEGTRREGARVGYEAVENSGGEDEEDEFERYQREVWAAKRGLVLDGGQAEAGAGASSRAGQQGRVRDPGRGTLRGEAGGGGGGSNYANKLAALELDDEVEEYRREVARARYPEVNSEQKGKRWFGLGKGKGKGKQRDEVAERVAATQVRTEARNVRWG